MDKITPFAKRRFAVLAVAAGVAAALPAAAQSADALLDKLVEKGVLTTDEAGELREQADKDFTRAYQVKSGMPDWVTTFRIGGDFRARYEGFYSPNTDFLDFSRFRYRVRTGFYATIQDNFEVGVRLASGNLDNASTFRAGADPISNNQTLQNNASKKGIFIDLAYMKWSPINTPNWQGAFTVGKMENPFIMSDMIFDNDYTPEGASEVFTYRINNQHSLALIAGQFVLDENSLSSHDPYLLGGQSVLASTWTPKISTTLGGGYLAILNTSSLTSASVPDINFGNLRYTQGAGDAVILGAPVSQFATAVGSASATYMLDSAPMYAGAFPLTLNGEFAHNFLATTDQNNGYMVGATLGKAGKRGTWEVSYRWKVLEGDAWWEELTDSDFGAYYPVPTARNPPFPSDRHVTTGYLAGTNTKGSVIRLAYSPYDFLTLQTTLFLTKLIIPYHEGSVTTGYDLDTSITRIQVDAIIKF